MTSTMEYTPIARKRCARTESKSALYKNAFKKSIHANQNQRPIERSILLQKYLIDYIARLDAIGMSPKPRMLTASSNSIPRLATPDRRRVLNNALELTARWSYLS